MKITSDAINFNAKKIRPEKARTINSTLLNSNKVDILCHETTDRDSANSALAMWEYLASKGIQSRIIVSGNLKELDLRNKCANIVQAKDVNHIEEDKADTVLCVDLSAYTRLPAQTLPILAQANNVACFDHHNGFNLVQNEDIKSDNSSIYVDKSALSATSIIYRYFEALNEEINEDRAYDLFSGLISDCTKKGFVVCDGARGVILPTDELIHNQEAFEVYNALREKISDEKIAKLAKSIDVMSRLSDEEISFYHSLKDKAKVTSDGKIVYLEIKPNDSTWEKLGSDNERTSKILSTFRQETLKQKDEKFKDAQVVYCFYRAKDVYRLSVHSNVNLKNIYKAANDKFLYLDGFSMGGHSYRGGGKIASLNQEDCNLFVQEIVKLSQENI